MPTAWQQIEAGGISEISGLPGVCIDALAVSCDSRGSLHELYRSDEIQHELDPDSPYRLSVT